MSWLFLKTYLFHNWFLSRYLQTWDKFEITRDYFYNKKVYSMVKRKSIFKIILHFFSVKTNFAKSNLFCLVAVLLIIFAFNKFCNELLKLGGPSWEVVWQDTWNRMPLNEGSRCREVKVKAMREILDDRLICIHRDDRRVLSDSQGGTRLVRGTFHVNRVSYEEPHN